MSSLLTLAKDLELKSKEQQQSTERMLKTVFSEHERSVRQELNESAKRISDAISAHEKGMTEAMQSNRLSVMRMVGRTWLTITMVSGLLFSSLSGVLWYQGSLIASNQAEIVKQNAALSTLNAKTWGVTHQEDNNGRFLVLPKGMKAETGWTADNGKRNAVKLVKE
ncbi:MULTISPECIES: MbeB family mobilization protein [Enterobacteriaceae]|uniref:Mobilization protein n=3 Tax=Enterobacteriaceae TaxID=543 RepID=Q51607_ECOLX|nr:MULTISPECIES: MbeB family mobilization protein [Enterobacteriaceae]HBN5546843.1 MbeB family mobilization protein [Enterobacter cloacae]HCT2234222.1 MbeB family mobilization protein [Enterobacter hormaechei]AAA72875.1 unknown [Escherichia coli]EGC9813993.1 mobilization protein [Escherichia coli]EHZ8216382.1 MbeB family mobilization protein [Escherichia coli]